MTDVFRFRPKFAGNLPISLETTATVVLTLTHTPPVPASVFPASRKSPISGRHRREGASRVRPPTSCRIRHIVTSPQRHPSVVAPRRSTRTRTRTRTRARARARARARRTTNIALYFACFVYFVVHQHPHSIRVIPCPSVVEKPSLPTSCFSCLSWIKNINHRDRNPVNRNRPLTRRRSQHCGKSYHREARLLPSRKLIFAAQMELRPPQKIAIPSVVICVHPWLKKIHREPGLRLRWNFDLPPTQHHKTVSSVLIWSPTNAAIACRVPVRSKSGRQQLISPDFLLQLLFPQDDEARRGSMVARATGGN